MLSDDSDYKTISSSSEEESEEVRLPSPEPEKIESPSLSPEESVPMVVVEPEPQAVEELCHCKNGKCTKNYCICLKAGRPCSDKCHCVQCENVDEDFGAETRREF